MQFTRLGQLHGEEFLTEGRLDFVTRDTVTLQPIWHLCLSCLVSGRPNVLAKKLLEEQSRGENNDRDQEGNLFLSFDTFVFLTFSRLRLANVKRDEERGREGFRWTNVCAVFGKNLRGWSLRICVRRPTTRQFEHSLQRIVIYCQALFRTWRRQCRGSRIRSKNREAVQRWSLGKLGGRDS